MEALVLLIGCFGMQFGNQSRKIGMNFWFGTSLARGRRQRRGWHVGSDWPSEEKRGGCRAGWPRLLDRLRARWATGEGERIWPKRERGRARRWLGRVYLLGPDREREEGEPIEPEQREGEVGFVCLFFYSKAIFTSFENISIIWNFWQSHTSQ